MVSATVPYVCTDNTNWETGLGVWSGGQIQRNTIYQSSYQNTNVNFSGANLNVFLDTPAAVFATYLTGITSGQISSGMLGAGSVVASSIASGVLPSSFTLSSGIISSGSLGAASVNTPNYSSGSIPQTALASGVGGSSFTLTSGIVVSGDIGNNAVNSGNISSGSIGQYHLGSAFSVGQITSGQIASGVIPPAFSLSSGIVGSGMLANASVVSGSIASGVLPVSFSLASGIVTSGDLGAASVNTPNYASGSIPQSALASGVGGGGSFTLSSGIITSGDVGNNAVTSGNIASGAVGLFHMASGFAGWSGGGGASITSGSITSGDIGNNAVTSGNIASGAVGLFQLASGAINGLTATYAENVAPFPTNAGVNPITQELISGAYAVAISPSGNLWIAMASVSGRMPAVGVVAGQFSSGVTLGVNLVSQGIGGTNASGLTNFAQYGQPVWVGRSGQLCLSSGGFMSGGFASGDVRQQIGTSISSGFMIVNPGTPFLIQSGGL